MTGVALTRDIGALLHRITGEIVQATAGGSGDNTEAISAYVDRTDYGSCKVLIEYTATMGAGETLTLAAGLKDATSSGGTGAAAFGTGLSATVIATGPSPQVAQTGCIELDYNLNGARQYIAATVTPNLSASGTDTCVLGVSVVGGGNRENPVTARSN